MLDVIGSLIGAGVNAWSGSQQRDLSREQFNQNMAWQQELARSGIRMRVADSQAAGIHPLVGLGAPTMSASPISAGDSGASQFSEMGQDISRALKAVQSHQERAQQDEEKLRKLSIEKAGLENEAMRSQIRRTSAASGQVGPGFPLPTVPAGALAHLSRSPRRGAGDYPIDDKKMEEQSEATNPFRRGYIFGAPYEPSPNFTVRGQNAEDLFGDEGMMNRVMNNLALISDWRHNWANVWGPYFDKMHVPNYKSDLPTGRYKRRYRMWGE